MSRLELLVEGPSTRGVINGIDEVPGWDARILNEEMLEMVRREYPETAERIETKSYYRWQEENKKTLSVLGQMATEVAYGLMFYECMIAEKPYLERIERERAYRATKEAGGETAKGSGENGNVETGGTATGEGEGGTAIINPNEIRYSQSSVNGSSEIIDSMKQNGWKGDPIDVVEMPDGVYTTIDNTRVVSAREAGIDVQATTHNYNDPLPIEYVERFTTKQGVPTTWGAAIELRIGKQKTSFRNANPFGSFEMENIK
ncbi:MAG: hypothetical protein K2H52_06275 [Lachnospiraceae bacterium]|nr:hypothetical protein [Lachnospiraceae bacterium]